MVRKCVNINAICVHTHLTNDTNDLTTTVESAEQPLMVT